MDVTVTYQNFGSAYLVVLRGRQHEIELGFNSLFNFCATNGELNWPEQSKTIATFWTDKEALQKYWSLRFEFGEATRNLGDHARDLYVAARMEELSENHEQFLDFSNSFVPEVHSLGTVKAERPDEDLRDMFVTNGLKDKADSQQVEEAVEEV